MKKTLPFSICFLLSLVFAGCTHELEYDGKTRLVYEGRVTDGDGQPLPGIPVNVYVRGDGDRDVIAYTQTNNEGLYRLIFPKPMNSEDISLEVNHGNESFAVQPEYTKFSYYNLKDENLSDYKIAFEDVKLYKTVDSVKLTLDFTNNDPLYLVNGQLTGLVDDNLIDYNFSIPEQNTEPDLYNFNAIHFVRKNQVINLKYIVYNPSSATLYTMGETVITVGEEDITIPINL